MTIKLRKQDPKKMALPEMRDYVRELASRRSVGKIESLRWSTERDVTLREFTNWLYRH